MSRNVANLQSALRYIPEWRRFRPDRSCISLFIGDEIKIHSTSSPWCGTYVQEQILSYEILGCDAVYSGTRITKLLRKLPLGSSSLDVETPTSSEKKYCIYIYMRYLTDLVTTLPENGRSIFIVTTVGSSNIIVLAPSCLPLVITSTLYSG